MKGKQTIKIIIMSMVFFLALMSTRNVLADQIEPIKINTTKQYEAWRNLTDSEKSNYIIPAVTPVQYNVKTRDRMLKVRATLPATYNLNDTITIPVKHQGNTGECWAFSMNSVLESNIAMKMGKTSVRYSERFMDYVTSRTFKDGVNEKGFGRELGTGGNSYIAMAHYTNGTGAVKESDMPFQDNEEKINLSEIENKKAITKVNNAKFFPSVYKVPNISTGSTSGMTYTDGSDKKYTEEEVTAIRNEIKQYIMENGAVASLTYSSPEYYNNAEILKATAYYCDASNPIANHAITIVGWDDNYAVTNFNEAHRPSKPGAYLVLNSYGTENFDKGYIYVSYEDALIESSIAGISKTEQITYDNIYQHDFYGYNLEFPVSLTDQSTGKELKATEIYAANVFQKSSKNKEILKEILVATDSENNVEVYVNPIDDSLQMSKFKKVEINTTKLEATYNTLTLKEPIELTGDKFAVAIKYTNANGVGIGLEANYKALGASVPAYDYVTAQKGESFISIDGNEWQDLIELGGQANLCLKAYTTVKEEITKPEDNNTTNTVNTTNTTNTVKPNSTDNTLANNILPNAGKFGLGILISIVGIIGIISYINYRRYKIVK